MLRAVFFITFIMLISASINLNAGIYKYQDDHGKWHFSDKEPSSSTATSIETLQYKSTEKNAKPEVIINKVGQQFELLVHNPFYALIEVQVQSSMFAKGFQHQILEANSSTTLLRHIKKVEDYKLYWALGDPRATHTAASYHFPVISKQAVKISQAFNGQFSHNKQPNKYAVDIALPVGTYLTAARSGTVIRVKDDFHMGAAKQYFVDKANVIEILHEDGSYATYGHILLGSALVRPGDKVHAGDKIARSGSTGYSTGPHLHFVVRRNIGFKTISEQFNFIDAQNNSFTPTAGMIVDGL